VAEPLNAETPTSGIPLNPMGSIPVLARLVDVDGTERWVPATANRWTAAHVLVCWREDPTQPRQESLCWLPARDVARQLRGAELDRGPLVAAVPGDPPSHSQERRRPAGR
jgi:hypothetical protein